MSIIRISFWLCMMVCLSVQAQAKEVMTVKVGGHLAADVYSAIEQGGKAVMCPYSNTFVSTLNDHLISYGVVGEQSEEFIEQVKTSLVKNCASKDFDVLLQIVIEDARSAMRKPFDVEKHIVELGKKVDLLNAARRPKVIRPAAEVDQLYDIVCDNPRGWLADENTTHRCEGSKPETMELKMQVVEASLFPKTKDTLKKDGMIERINVVRLKLNHIDWDKDRYWFGINQGWVGNINGLVTSVNAHVYPWYTRSVSIYSMEDILRRTSVFVGLGQLTNKTTNNADPNNIIEYKGKVYSTGFGLEIGRGFMLTIGKSFYQEVQASGHSQYVQDTIVGITMDGDAIKKLFGVESQ